MSCANCCTVRRSDALGVFFVGSTSPGIDPLTAPFNDSSLFKLDESSLDLGLRAVLQASLDYLGAGS